MSNYSKRVRASRLIISALVLLPLWSGRAYMLVWAGVSREVRKLNITNMGHRKLSLFCAFYQYFVILLAPGPFGILHNSRFF